MKSSTVFVLLPTLKRRLSHGKQPVKLALHQTSPSRDGSIHASQTSDEKIDSGSDPGFDSGSDSGSDCKSSAESDSSGHNEPPVHSSSTTKTRTSPSRAILAAGNHPRNSKTKPYVCTHSGCNKSYRKPSRLQEYERSHTGERPYVCPTCQKSYLRESHLRSHSRSHLPASAKPFICAYQVLIPSKRQVFDLVSTQRDLNGDPGPYTSVSRACGQKFWTTQHLRVHEKAIHLGEKPHKCTFCPAGFTKHGALRAHTAESHSLPGTKPYQCDHSGCKQSFATNQKLKIHFTVHDVTRHACVHYDCSTGVMQFSTWTTLQGHMRTVHPPKCPYESCQGRTFTATRGLKSHLKTHRDREFEEVHEEISLEAWNDTVGQKRAHTEQDRDATPNEPPLKRRRGGEVGRDWPCPQNDCDKAFKSKKAQQDHVSVSHEGTRNFPCPMSDCTLSFGHKHVMQRHVERHHSNHRDEPSTDPTPDTSHALGQTISLLTGQDYLQVSNRQRVIACPWPDAFGTGNAAQAPDPTPAGPRCGFVFSRTYDLRRHLRGVHGLEVDAVDVNSWISERKK